MDIVVLTFNTHLQVGLVTKHLHCQYHELSFTASHKVNCHFLARLFDHKLLKILN